MKKNGLIAFVHLGIFGLGILITANANSVELMIMMAVMLAAQTIFLLVAAIIAFANQSGNGAAYLAILMVILIIGWPGCFVAGIMGIKMH